jgi:hypothetical protein
MIDVALSVTVAGGPAAIRARLDDLVARPGAYELGAGSQILDPVARLRSAPLVA